MSNKPAPLAIYEICRGDSPQATHVCDRRKSCERFKTAEYRGNWKDFWIADSCPKFELKNIPLPEEKSGLDW